MRFLASTSPLILVFSNRAILSQASPEVTIMWHLELLSQVIPAFGALAMEYIEHEQDARLRRDAQDCYADLVTVGLAVALSYGEWTSGLDDRDIIKLLAALETRLPSKKRPFQMVFQGPNAREVRIICYG